MGRSGIDRRHYPIQLRKAIGAYLPTRGLALLSKDRWSDRVLALVMILMVFSSRSTLQDRFTEARSVCVRMYFSRRRPGRTFAGFIKKMQRHSKRLLALISRNLRGRMCESSGEYWRVGRFLAFGVDGTKIDCPRTKANQAEFRNGGRKKSGPQMLLVSLIHLGTGLVWGWRKTHAKGSERGLLREMLEELPAGSLLVADAGFVGYDVMCAILGSGRSILMRVGANTMLLKKLGYVVKEKGPVVYLWPRAAQRKSAPPLVLRRIVLKDGRNREMCLLTNVLLEVDLSENEAKELYSRRWQVELLYRTMKQTLSRRKMLSDSPEHAEVELDWSVLGQWLLGLMLWEAREEKASVQEGFAGILRVVRCAMVGYGDRRCGLKRQLERLSRDRYVRRGSKKSRDWPHKKNDPPCRVPEMRMATIAEVRLAKRLRISRIAA